MAKHQQIELPAPTYWPMVAALGLTLLLAGLLTHWLISLVGFILSASGGIGWFRDVFPHARHEILEVDVEQAAIKNLTAQHSVANLNIGKAGHRIRYPEHVHPMTTGIKGGLLGGVVMSVMAVLYGYFFKNSLWWTVNLLAAIALPSMQNASAETLLQFSALGLFIAIIVHFFTSCFVGLLLAAVLPMFPRYAFIWAGLLSPAIWSALFFATLHFINPAMSDYINWTWFFICQLGFALVAGYYIKTSVKIETLQTYPLAIRAGLERLKHREDSSDE